MIRAAKLGIGVMTCSSSPRRGSLLAGITHIQDTCVLIFLSAHHLMKSCVICAIVMSVTLQPLALAGELVIKVLTIVIQLIKKKGGSTRGRQCFKQSKLESMFPQKPTDNATSKIPSFQDPVPQCYSNLNPLLVPGSRSNSLQTCSAASISNSNAINQRNYYQSTIISYPFQRLGQRPTKSYPLNPSVQYIHTESRVAGALTTQLMNSHTRFKRATTMQNRFTSLNSPPHNPIASGNRTPSGVLQKSTYATRTSQRPRSPQVGQQRSEDPLATSPGASADQMLANISSHFTLPTKQSSMCPPVTAADDSQESWQNVLASVASELGVSMFSDPATSNAQRPPMFPSSSPPFDESYSKTDASQDTWSVPANSNPGSLDYDCRWSHDTMAQIQEHSPVEDPHL
ncbi:hypothetical protein MUK42_02178 [Musa troglodytarum]|uniref:Uncharacterized protein n=1 Tax=Musa troglodytarum TaxID=320322 RepID=A0A9E7ELZ0_9LILI|nr:hypothetical protein MUK42_02178 [Musa troglodytarum]URD79998.1 hypothetical protein MUK42_02178 [Musa troglodytarum]URD79999.1 hypothetical protein MUK42_02178 [Musa troglodytarum]URD80000.1 hypothetical protein MUK42_02178 [Musa troglodytarum]URD80002.1 hypothetical protein MUK42_02178 [Musa troglodytarum]